MRLSPEEIAVIKQQVINLDPQAEVYLFGSRLDDSLKGGDIDLLILSKIINSELRRQLKIKLYDFLGEQKIDIIVTDEPQTVFEKIALKNGVRL